MDKTTDDWIELEYSSLRSEILQTMRLVTASVKFFLPMTGILYAAPIACNKQSSLTLWCAVAFLVGIGIIAMCHTMFCEVDTVRKIGMYIKEVIEPRTRKGMLWEKSIFHLEGGPTNALWVFQSYEGCIAVCSLAANLLCSFVVGREYLLNARWTYLPFSISLVMSLPVVVFAWRIFQYERIRENYATWFRRFAEGELRKPNLGND